MSNRKGARPSVPDQAGLEGNAMEAKSTAHHGPAERRWCGATKFSSQPQFCQM
jgi:hypothetical protein